MLVARHARQLRAILSAILLVTMAVEALAVARELFALFHAAGGTSIDSATPSWEGWFCDLVSAIAVTAGLWRLVGMSGALAAKGKLVPSVTRNLRSFAYWMLVAASSSSLLPLVIAIAERTLAFPHASEAVVSGSDLLLLLIAGVLVPITQLLASANQAQDELERII